MTRPPGPKAPVPPPTTTGYVVSLRRAFQMTFMMLAGWSGLSGFLIAVVGGDVGGVFSGGMKGDPAGSRLFGAQLLLITPVYVFLSLNMHRFRRLLWFPVAAQAAVLVPSIANVSSGDRSFSDAAMPMLVSAMFLAVMTALLLLREKPTAPRAGATAPGSRSEAPPITPGRAGSDQPAASATGPRMVVMPPPGGADRSGEESRKDE